MKILILTPSLAIGGAERAACNIADALARTSLRPSVSILAVTSPASGSSTIAPPAEIPTEIQEHRRMVQGVFPALRVIHRDKPDVVISHQRPLNLLLAAFLPIMKLLLGYRPKLIAVEHAVPLFIYRWTSSRKDGLLEHFVPLFYRAADAVVCPSTTCAEAIRKKWPQLSKKTFAIPNPVPPPSTRSQLIQDDKKKPSVLLVGRLDDVKDFSLAIRAFEIAARHNDIELIIIGDGPERNHLAELVAKLGISSRVTFTGFVNDPNRFFSKRNLVLMTSRAEHLPMVLIEALRGGCNIVSVDCPVGPREILENGSLGTLVLTRNPNDIARAIEARLQNPIDPERLRAAAARYAPEKIGQEYGNLASSLAQGPHH